MRISDWSSDVCSSDLVLRVEHVEQRTAADRKLLAIGQQQLVGRLALVDEVAEHRGLRLAGIPRAARVGFGIAFGFVQAETEIGRASCRESVCRYGYTWVVAES